MYKVKYEGIVANYNPAFEKTVERHDAILPSQYKLLAYHKGVLMPVEQTPYAAKYLIVPGSSLLDASEAVDAIRPASLL